MCNLTKYLYYRSTLIIGLENLLEMKIIVYISYDSLERKKIIYVSGNGLER